MRRTTTAGLTAALLAAGLLTTTGGPAHADPPATGYTLVFNDDFDGTAVDTTKWTYRTDVKAYSAQRPENVTVGGGLMSINLKQENHAGMEFTGGGLVSRQRLRYGYYETRAKINDGAGWHSSFWLMAGDGSTTFPAEARTEVDGFEIDSISPSNVHQGVHSWAGGGVRGPYHPGSTYGTGTDLRQWHTWGFDWSETSVKFYLDGVLRYSLAYTPSQWTHDYVNIWLTSIAYGTRPDVSKLPSAVQFDYVRYWQRDYYVDNDSPASYGYSETGSWQDSTLTGWTYGSPTRYAACHSAGHTATWRPNLRAAASYAVYAHRVAHSGSDPAARYDVVHNGVTSTTVVNGTTGSSGWVPLGTFAFAAGTGGYVRLTASGTGCARADAVKFVRA